jgi:hypothetical protein
MCVVLDQENRRRSIRVGFAHIDTSGGVIGPVARSLNRPPETFFLRRQEI